MKNLTLTFTMALVTIGIAAFGQQDKKSEKARKNVAEAKEDLRLAENDSVEDYRNFKKEAEIKISNNQQKIADLKTKKWNENSEVKEKYDKKVLALEQKNNKLKKEIEGSNHTKTMMWSSFKREWNHDMDELGSAFKDLTIDNAK